MMLSEEQVIYTAVDPTIKDELSGVYPLAYDTDGAVRASNLGRNTIIAAMDSGKLIARKSGRRIVILHDDLMKFLRALPPRKVEQWRKPEPKR